MLKKMGFDIHSVWFWNDMLVSMWNWNKRMWSWNCFCSFCYVDSIFACFYLTRQLKSILQNFWLAGVVLVVLNPHVFNLTGQLESKPPEFPTLAATDCHQNGGQFSSCQKKSLILFAVCLFVCSLWAGPPKGVCYGTDLNSLNSFCDVIFSLMRKICYTQYKL
jgi:hypothetical protein